MRRRGGGPRRRVAQGRREAGTRRRGPWRGVRAEVEGGEVDGVTAGMSPKAASRVGWQEVAAGMAFGSGEKKGAASPRSDATPWCAA